MRGMPRSVSTDSQVGERASARPVRVHEKHFVRPTRLERLGRYLLRPAICLDRLRLREDGLYQYDFKRAWSDGTVGIVLEPVELMEKLAALIPIPRANLIRYHGVLAPSSSVRDVVVPHPEADADCSHIRPGGLAPAGGVGAWLGVLT